MSGSVSTQVRAKFPSARCQDGRYWAVVPASAQAIQPSSSNARQHFDTVRSVTPILAADFARVGLVVTPDAVQPSIRAAARTLRRRSARMDAIAGSFSMACSHAWREGADTPMGAGVRARAADAILAPGAGIADQLAGWAARSNEAWEASTMWALFAVYA